MAIPYLTTATLPYGSRVVTVATAGYIANSFTTSQPLNVIERQNELGAPNGAVGIQQPITGSASLQLALAATAIPSAGDEFSATIAGTAITFFITERGLPEEQAGFKTVDISFRQSI
jgi:hypothetical protein